MEKFKNIIRRFALILLIVMVSLIPVPILFPKKEGKFNSEDPIELVEQKKDDVENEVTFKKELKS